MKTDTATKARRLRAAQRLIAKNSEAREVLNNAFTNKPKFTRAQIAKMSREEYRRNRSAIFEAQRNNLIK